MRIELHFMGPVGLAAGQKMLTELREAVDHLERWNAGTHSEFTKPLTAHAGMVIDVPPEVRVTIDTLDFRERE